MKQNHHERDTGQSTDVADLLATLNSEDRDDWGAVNKLLEPILLAAVRFYNRHDDDVTCRALGASHGLISININGIDDQTVDGIVADMAVVASFINEAKAELLRKSSNNRRDAGADAGAGKEVTK